MSLQFGEYLPEGWQWRRLSQLADINPGSPNLDDSTLVSFVTMADVTETGRMTPSDTRPFGAVKNGYTPFQEGDVLLAKITPCFENGKGAIATRLSNGIGFGSTEFHILRPKPGTDRDFLFAHTRTREFRRYGEANMTGSAGQKRLPKAFISDWRIPTPPISEQRQIAKILSTWDETLERLSRQIERKTKVFSSLHETLITGRRRLRGWSSKWSLVPIGRFLAPVRRPVPKPAEPYRALSIRSHGKGTFQRLVDRPDTVEMDTLYRVGARDLIVNITFAWEGAIALANREDEGCLVSHRFPTFAIDENVVDRDFLGYAVNNRRFFHQLGIVSPGGAGRNRVLNQRDFLEIEIACPSLDEQHAIARVLLDSQREIAALKAERAALAKQRDALATELLTGRLRVPQAEAAS